MDVRSNALELFNAYKNYYQKNETPVGFVSKTQMVLIRCVVPALGGPKPKGKHSNQDDFNAAMDFLQSISLEQTFNQKEHWTYLKKLINWAT